MNPVPPGKDTLEVESGTIVKYLTGPQTPPDENGPGNKGCEGVWYEGTTATIAFQYELMDADEDTTIAVGNQVWTVDATQGEVKKWCYKDGQVVVTETYVGAPGTEFRRKVYVTTLISVAGDTTASDEDYTDDLW
jgi:hypothetical protein